MKSTILAKKSVLLINLPGDSLRMPEEHCGLAFLKAYLDKQNIDVQILDAYALKLSVEETKENINKWKESRLYNVRNIGIAPFVTSHASFIEIGQYIKSIDPECCLFAGGHYASLNRKYLFNNCTWLDAIIVGEGEITLLELLEYGIQTNIPGLYIGQKDEQFKKRKRIKDLDRLPFQSRYLSLAQLNGQPMTITTSRGCYGECSFCSISSFYKLNGDVKQTFRSAKSVSREIQKLVHDYGIKYLKIVDDNFFRDTSDDFLDALSKEISSLHLSIRLSARPNDITKNRAKLLKEMGVKIVGIGAESADERSLQFFNKGIGIKESESAIKLLDENGITTLVNYITFNPIIDIEGVRKNLDFINKYKDIAVFHRINSHLWIRLTDPLVINLKEMGLCKDSGFPYLDCNYAYTNVQKILCLFNKWCKHNMKEYYEQADVLMAKGIIGNEKTERKYRRFLNEDIIVLSKLLDLEKQGTLDRDGFDYINECLNNDSLLYNEVT